MYFYYFSTSAWIFILSFNIYNMYLRKVLVTYSSPGYNVSGSQGPRHQCIYASVNIRFVRFFLVGIAFKSHDKVLNFRFFNQKRQKHLLQFTVSITYFRFQFELFTCIIFEAWTSYLLPSYFSELQTKHLLHLLASGLTVQMNRKRNKILNNAKH